MCLYFEQLKECLSKMKVNMIKDSAYKTVLENVFLIKKLLPKIQNI